MLSWCAAPQTLGGLIARMYVVDPEYVKSKYNLPMLRELENLVAEAVQISVPFNNPITGFCAFTHKAGIHAKAILANPSTYEILKPEDFGMSRYIDIGSRLTGWNAVGPHVLAGFVLERTSLTLCTSSSGQIASGAARARVDRRPGQGRDAEDQGARRHPDTIHGRRRHGSPSLYVPAFESSQGSIVDLSPSQTTRESAAATSSSDRATSSTSSSPPTGPRTARTSRPRVRPRRSRRSRGACVTCVGENGPVQDCLVTTCEVGVHWDAPSFYMLESGL